MEEILVYPCGTKVTLRIANITGEISAFTVRFKQVTYEFTYFYNGEMTDIWVCEEQLDFFSEPIKQKIGFNCKSQKTETIKK